MEHATITKTETVPVGQLKSHPDNARRGNVTAIANSLRENGQFKPIVVQETTGYILAGNHTYRAAVDKLGWTHIQATFVNCTDARARAILAVDNRTSDQSGYDDQALADLLQQLDNDSLLTVAGYTEDDLDDLLAKLEETIPNLEDEDDEPEPANEVKEAKSLTEKADAYDAQTSRMVVLNYPLKQFSYVVMQLEALAEEHHPDNNADVILYLLENATGLTPPKAD